jgi:hypothetical protein
MSEIDPNSRPLPAATVELPQPTDLTGSFGCFKVIWENGTRCLGCAWKAFELLTENYCEQRAQFLQEQLELTNGEISYAAFRRYTDWGR